MRENTGKTQDESEVKEPKTNRTNRGAKGKREGEEWETEKARWMQGEKKWKDRGKRKKGIIMDTSFEAQGLKEGR